jgi:two-component system LytT family response regulator
MSPLDTSVRAIVVDDDRFAHAQLEAHLRRHRGTVELVARCESGEEGARAIGREKPDLVFLDVQMPGMDGFGLLDKVEKRDFGVIFITGFERYAIRAIRYSALDFLLKPYTAQDFDAAIARFIAQRELMPARMEFLLDNKPAAETAPATILIPTRTGDRRVRTQDIVRC